MALVIDGGTTGATGAATAGATGTAVIASGKFGDSTVQVTVDKDLGRPAPVYTFHSPGAVWLDTPGARVSVEIAGGTGVADIDVVVE